MNVDTYDFVHMALHAMGGEIAGKTKLQKVMYFLGVATGHVEELGYRPHFFGPYSAQVSDAMGRLVALDFAHAHTSVWGVDARGFEKHRTDYRLNDDGKYIADEKAAKNSELWEQLQAAAQLSGAMMKKDYTELSIAAKTYFMLSGKEQAVTPKQLSEIAQQFGWSVQESEIRSAAQFLSGFGLVRLVESTAN